MTQCSNLGLAHDVHFTYEMQACGNRNWVLRTMPTLRTKCRLAAIETRPCVLCPLYVRNAGLRQSKLGLAHYAHFTHVMVAAIEHAIIIYSRGKGMCPHELYSHACSVFCCPCFNVATMGLFNIYARWACKSFSFRMM